MPSTARRVDSIRPRHPDSFRIGILRLSIRQLSASDGRGAWLSCMDTAAPHARARAGGFKQAGQPGCGLDGGRPVHPPRRLRPHEMSSNESQAGQRLDPWPSHCSSATLVRTATTSDPGLTRGGAMLELIVAGRPEFRSRMASPVLASSGETIDSIRGREFDKIKC